MDKPGLVGQRELAQWAETVPSRTELPRLVRRLILETADGLVQVGMPAAEGVSSGGWDGTARATAPTAFVPDGLSLWELSVEKSVNTKAQSDYDKRTATPDGSPTTDCTYLAGSLRRWMVRSTWAAERTLEGRWRSVRALGLDDIETWLEDAPVTHAWLSEKLGLHPFGFRAAEAWWHSWSSQTSPPIGPDLLLAGRDAEAESLVDALGGGPRTLTVAGPNLEETRAFLVALAIKMDREGDSQALARMALVDGVEAWRSLVQWKAPMVLIPMDLAFASEVPGSSPHHVLVPVQGNSGDIVLPSIDAEAAAAALVEAGMKDADRATRAGHLGRRSITALRRHLAVKPELHRPAWAQGAIPRSARAALLASAWAEAADGDREVLGELAGADYEAFAEQIAGVANNEDPLVERLRGSWHLVSPWDAWLLLGRSLTDDDLRRLESVCDRVLGEPDPAFGLPDEERWLAGVRGLKRRYSEDLRVGLARTLVLLALHGPTGEFDSSAGDDWAGYLVRKILNEASQASGEGWASLSDVLPLLAEAAPDQFLEAVTHDLSGPDQRLGAMFQEEGSLFGPGSPHHALLGSLERLAWSPAHFGAVVDLLARLDALDPTQGRPAESLATIFCPWHPETTASVARRLDVLDGLRVRHPDLAWQLSLKLLPEFHAAHFPSSEPTYRDWKPAANEVSRVEYYGFVSELVRRCLEDSGSNGGRWVELLDRMAQLPPADREAVLGRFSAQVAAEAFDAENALAVWTALRRMIGRHREFEDADWALPEEDLAHLESLASALEPTSDVELIVYLFDEHMPSLGDRRARDDYDVYKTELADRRERAVSTLKAQGGLEEVLRLTRRSVVPHTIGIALAKASDSDWDSLVLPLVNAPEPSEREMASAYFGERFRLEGWPWLESLFDSHPDTGDTQRARILLATGDLADAPAKAAELGDGVRTAYWDEFQPWAFGEDANQREMVVRELNGVGRFVEVLKFVATLLHANRATDESMAVLAAETLSRLLEDGPSSANMLGSLSSADFQVIFGLLETHRAVLGEDQVGQLEWAFLPALGYEPGVPTLHSRMAQDPAFFVEVVATVYQPANPPEGAPAEISPTEEARAANAHRLLSSWESVPGMSADGILDGALLETWVQATISLLQDKDRSAVGLVHVGQCLAFAPPDLDGSAPSEAVRELLEATQSPELEDGLETQIQNNRGVTTRGVTDGGAQERTLAARYRADADGFADRWPRTAAVLRRLAKSYEREPKRAEAAAERFRRGVDI